MYECKAVFKFEYQRRINIFINLTNEVIKKENKQSYSKEEFLKIAFQVFDIDKEIDLDFQKMILEDWD